MPVKKTMGRPRKTFDEKDWQLIEGMCKILCTAEEIADILKVSVDTLSRRVKEQYKITFADYLKKYAAYGKSSLRRNLFKQSEKSPATAIFLAKNYLGMRDEPQEEKDDRRLNRLIEAVKNVK